MTSFGANPVETVLGGDVALLDAVVEGFYGAGDAQRVRFFFGCGMKSDGCGSQSRRWSFVRSFVGTAKWERNAGVRVFRRAMGV